MATGPAGCDTSVRPTEHMAHSDIPKNVRQLIVRHIDSVQQVEILALLQGDPEREWTAAEISRALHIPPQACGEWLDAFASARLVVRGQDGYKHSDRGGADHLVECYSRRRLAVIDSIYNKPSTAIQSFSDAFRLRKDD
jgi:hypothetical protein